MAAAAAVTRRLTMRTAKSVSEIMEAITEGNLLQWNIAAREARVLLAASQVYVCEQDAPAAAPEEATRSALGWISSTRYPSSHGGAVRSQQDYVHVSLYLTRAAHRGAGVGSVVWRHMMESSAGCCHGLDAVADSVRHYEARGFRIAFRLPLYFATAAAMLRAAAEQAAVEVAVGTAVAATEAPKDEGAVDLHVIEAPAAGESLTHLSPLWDALVEYDGVVTGVRRGPLLRAHALDGGDAHTVVAVRTGSGAVCGYCTRVADDSGSAELSPLIADSPSIARRLAAAAAAGLPADAAVAFWPPAANPHALAVATSSWGA